jgi:hypothetical protein
MSALPPFPSAHFLFTFGRPMLTHLSEREIEILSVALRYWRRHRAESRTRSGDPTFTPESLNLLLAKLEAAKGITIATFPGDDVDKW